MNEIKFTDSDLEELKNAFLIQAREIAENLSAQIMAIEEDPSDDNWKALKRSFHTLKGDSKAMGYDGLGTLAHRVEDFIESAKNGGFSKEAVDLLFDCSDTVSYFIERLASGEQADVSEFISRLQSYVSVGTDIKRSVACKRDKSFTKTSGYIRIDAEKIDTMMNLVGELVIGRSMLNRISAESENIEKEEIIEQLENLSEFLDRSVEDLQRSVMKVRMLPIEQVFRRFPKLVRDLSNETGKSIVLQMEGEKTELDKSIADVIGEPLMHLLRNAIDHGIERPEVRVKSGKPPEGVIKLRAYHQGNHLVIEVQDDGKGIDTESLKKKALKDGLLLPEDAENIGESEALNLIFHSGLTTADRLTEVSGRGVGMDIVKEVVESLRGTVEISSEKGKGTMVSLRLPLTLAIIKAILFHDETDTFALPMASVTEILKVSPDDIDTITGFPMINHRDGVLPLISLSGNGYDKKKEFVLLFSVAQSKAGLMVDKVAGQENLVIKALDELTAGGIAAGASILGDGKVVLILDPLHLLRRAVRVRKSG